MLCKEQACLFPTIQKNKFMKIALIYNYKSPEDIQNKGEFHDSLLEWDDDETISAIQNAISKKYETHLIKCDSNLVENLKKIKPDFVFNIAEGEAGSSREAFVPAILEMLKIPFTGSDVGTMVNTLDKVRAKEILAYNNINTPNFICIYDINELDKIDLLNKNKTYILKPCWEGSSKGIFDNSISSDKKQIKNNVIALFERFNQPVIIEEFLTGREFTAALIGNGENLEVLPIVELDFSQLPKNSNPIYSYEAKWVGDIPEKPLKIFQCPANLDKELKKQIQDIAKKTFLIMRCRDWCRIDVRLDSNNVPYILELNPLPGILPNPDNNSCFPKAARAAGMNYEQLIDMVINTAMLRCGIINHKLEIINY